MTKQLASMASGVDCLLRGGKKSIFCFFFLIHCVFIPLSTSSFLFHKTGQTEVTVCCRCQSIFHV